MIRRKWKYNGRLLSLLAITYFSGQQRLRLQILASEGLHIFLKVKNGSSHARDLRTAGLPSYTDLLRAFLPVFIILFFISAFPLTPQHSAQVMHHSFLSTCNRNGPVHIISREHITNTLNPWSRDLPDSLISLQIVKNFSALYGAWTSLLRLQQATTGPDHSRQRCPSYFFNIHFYRPVQAMVFRIVGSTHETKLNEHKPACIHEYYFSLKLMLLLRFRIQLIMCVERYFARFFSFQNLVT
jgi:hypothetical protein